MRFWFRFEGWQAIAALGGLALGSVFLPRTAIDPWGLIHLNKIGGFIVALGVIQVSGALLVRWFGVSVGRILGGFLGGLVSSTAYSVRAARRSSENPEESLSRALGVTAAVMAMQVEAILLLGISDFHLLQSLGFAVFTPWLVGLSFVLKTSRESHRRETDFLHPVEFDLRSAIQWSLVIGGLISVVGWGHRWLGGLGIQVLTILASIFEVHGTLIATSQLSSSGAIPETEAQLLVILGLVTAQVSKIALAWGLGSRSFAKAVGLRVGAMAAVGLLAMAFL